MPLSVGDKLGHYEIVSLLGQGGMGEVYRARDTTLKREVALKVLPGTFLKDSERMARFQREAQVLASLDHPNIGHIYGIVDSEDSRGLVLALIEGPTLADRIQAGPLPWEEAVAISKQIVEALEYAHERGVVHRDLKPANIKVTAEGVVKVLDFGLAKVLEDEPPASSPGNSPTLTLGHTRAGMILGTAAYMSPEQAVGRPVDRRSDIFSFGTVLYEMLAGTRAFRGETTPDLLEAVVKSDPDWSALPAGTPSYLRKLLERTLVKDRKQRLQAIGEARIALESPGREVSPRVPEITAFAGQRHKTPVWSWAIAGVFAIAAAAVSVVHFRETQPELDVVRTAILSPEKSAFTAGDRSGPMALSPDGKRIVFAATGEDGKSQLWIRPLDGTAPQPIPGSTGGTFPFWSPDNRYVAFFAGGELKKVDTAGGPPVTLAEAPNPRGGSWSASGTIVFAPNNNLGGLVKISSSGGAATAATRPGQDTNGGNDRAPWFLPDGRHFLFSSLRPPNRVQVLVGSLDSGDTKTIAETGSNAVYSEGRLLFLRESTLMAQPFDLKTLTPSGEAVPIAERIQQSFSPTTVGMFSASATGLLAYRTGGSDIGLQLTWFDRAGKALGTVGDPLYFSHIELSPDRKNLVVSVFHARGEDLWTYDLSKGLAVRFTFDPARADFPLWSPDGRSIAFNSVRKGHWDLYRKSADGSGVEELMYADDREKYPNSWAPDGKLMVFVTLDGSGSNGNWALPLAAESPGAAVKPMQVLPPGTRYAKLSPDGRWVAYISEDSQRGEVYVSPFLRPGGKRQISTNGGIKPRWRRDGKEIFYLSPDGQLMATEVRISGEMVEVGATRALFGGITTLNGYAYDISADGQRILAAVAKEQTSNEPITLVQNWAAGLRK
jgi:Tol biopolymer transport system component